MNTSNFRFFAGFLIALLFPSIAFANGLTAVMRLEVIHLLFLNILIGIGEGLALAFVFKLRKQRTIIIMIIANYASAWAGYMGIFWQLDKIAVLTLDNAPLYHVLRFIAITALLAYVITVLVEWPFCAWVLSKKPHLLRNSFLASVVVNACSYAVIIFPYIAVSNITLGQLAVDPGLAMSNAQKYWVYYIASDDASISRIHPDGTDRQKMFDTNGRLASDSTDDYRLFVLPSQDPNEYDLWAGGPYWSAPKLLAMGLTHSSKLAQKPKNDFGDTELVFIKDSNALTRTGGIQYSVTDFRDPNERMWNADKAWKWFGFTIRNSKTKQELDFSVESPFLAWIVRSPIFLPGDFVVFQLGKQIVLMDINKHKVRLITLGRGPVVTLE